MDKKQPLFGRADHILRLQPFSFINSIGMLNSLGFKKFEKQILVYGLFGGIPKYLNYLQYTRKDARNIIKELFLANNAPLIEEGKNILIQEFGSEHKGYFSILEAIADGYNTPDGEEVRFNDPVSGISLTFDNVEYAGTTSVTSAVVLNPPSGFLISGIYYEITTNAEYTSTIHIEIPYDEMVVENELVETLGADGVIVAVIIIPGVVGVGINIPGRRHADVDRLEVSHRLEQPRLHQRDRVIVETVRGNPEFELHKRRRQRLGLPIRHQGGSRINEELFKRIWIAGLPVHRQ